MSRTVRGCGDTKTRRGGGEFDLDRVVVEALGPGRGDDTNVA